MTTEPSRKSKKRRTRLVVQIAVAVSVVVAIYAFALPRIAEFGDVWGWIREMTWLELTTLLLLGIWNIATYWILEVASFPGLSYWRASKVVLTSTAIANTLPGGGAFGLGVSAAMYRSYGYQKSEIVTAVVTQGVWNNFVKLGMPVVALALLVLSHGASSALIVASVAGLAMLIVGLVLFWLLLRSERSARAVARWSNHVIAALRRVTRKDPPERVEEGLLGFRHQIIGLVRARWLHLTLAALVSHITLYMVLLVSLRHVGVSDAAVSWVQVLAAFAFVRLISALPVTPGGLGVVELGLTAALVAAGGNEAKIVAAVLVFRALTYMLPIPLGGLGYLAWRRGRKHRRAVPVAVGLLCLLVLGACGRGAEARSDAQGRDDAIVVGSFDFSESVLLGELYASALEENGFPVTRALDLGSREFVQPALEQGRIDLVPEYLGAAVTFVTLGRVEATSSSPEMHRVLKRELAKRDIAVLDYARAQDRNGFVVSEDTATRLNLIRISDLKPFAPELDFGGPPECPERPTCLAGLERVYGLRFREFQPLDVGGPETIAALEWAEVDVGLMFTTDPNILHKDFTLLVDNKHLQPAENVVPVLSQETIDEHGREAVEVIDSVTARLTTDELRKLNERVAIGGRSPSVVARTWLEERGLLR